MQPSQRPATASRFIVRVLPFAWLALFFFLVVCFSSVRPPAQGSFAGLALAGLLYGATFEREQLLAVRARHPLLIGASVGVVLLILAAACAVQWRRPQQFFLPLPTQLGLLLCIWPLAALLAQRSRLVAVTLVFLALSAVHLAALPVEAVTGWTLSWQGEDLYPREMGPLRYQARGLAWQVYYFPGLFLAMFYLAAGAVGERRLFGPWRWGPRSWLVASLAWAAAVACLQSRSALAGALAASLVGVLLYGDARHRRLWLAAGAVAVAGAAVFWWLFSENKSSSMLRWAYVLLYFRRGLDPEWVWTGRGYATDADPAMQVPGLQFLVHSHNDFAQTLFSWGLPVLIAYLVFWGALVATALRHTRDGYHWPVLTLIAVTPNLLTDLGLHNLEKTAFIAVFSALVAAPSQAIKALPDRSPRS